jgi:hypothetical protein
MLKTNTILFLVALSILAVVHMVALELFLYWRYLWLDVPVHILGGIVVVLGAYTFNELKLPLAHFLVANVWHTFTFVVVVMIGWEIFEVWAGNTVFGNYFFDTALDLAAGFTGGLVGYLLAKRMQTL